MAAADDGSLPLDFPTLFIVPDWIARHCRIQSVGGLVTAPQPFEMYDWQLRATAQFYRVKPTATVGKLSTAFQHRRAQIVWQGLNVFPHRRCQIVPLRGIRG